MSDELKPMSALLDALGVAEQDCIDANVEENDYTIFSRQDLEFELELVQQAVAKKMLFIENQVRLGRLDYNLVYRMLGGLKVPPRLCREI